MDNAIITACIAAGSAFIGALIPCFFSYLGKRIEYKNNRNAEMENIRRQVYKQYIDAIQNMINNGDRDTFLSLQTTTNHLLLFSGPELSILINNYFNDITQRTTKESSLTKEEQTTYQTNIINAMRKELGISKGEIEKVSFVKAS